MTTPAARPVSVIVLTWNGLEVTRRCVDSLLGVTRHPDFEVVVVDNGSTDGTLEYLRGVEGVRLVENGENLGFVKGNNAGIRATSSDIVLVNNDTEFVEADWLSRMQALAYTAEDIGIVGCRLVNADGRLVHAGTYMPVPSFWGQEYPGDEADVGQYSRDREVDGVIAACAYIKREVIDRIGPLDEDYFSYYEDTDYCLKARQAGYRVFCCGTTVWHLENASTDLNRMDFSAVFRRSREVFLSKWRGYYDSFYTRRMTWHSCISGTGPYARASAKALWALDRAGVDVNLGFLEGAERAELADFRVNDMKNRPRDRDRPQVLFGPPGMLDRADGSYNIGFMFSACDRFVTAEVAGMNRMDEIWVTSDAQRETALASGVDRPVFVIPLGVDTDYFNPSMKAFPLEGRFTFLAQFDWGPGAAADTLLEAFTSEFGADDKVVLVVRVDTDSTGAEVEESVEAMALPAGRAPVVFVINHDTPAYQTGCLYRSADCLVLPWRARRMEPVAAEALACGVPVLGTGWVLDCLEAVEPEEGSVIEVGYSLVDGPLEGTRWAEPESSEMRRRLRHAVDESEPARRAAGRTAPRIAARLGWQAVADRIIARLDAIA